MRIHSRNLLQESKWIHINFSVFQTKGPFILHCNCVAVLIYWLLSAASHCSITAFWVKMNLTFMWHRNAVTLQFLCRAVQCGNTVQLRRSMNGPLVIWRESMDSWENSPRESKWILALGRKFLTPLKFIFLADSVSFFNRFVLKRCQINQRDKLHQIRVSRKVLKHHPFIAHH